MTFTADQPTIPCSRHGSLRALFLLVSSLYHEASASFAVRPPSLISTTVSAPSFLSGAQHKRSTCCVRGRTSLHALNKDQLRKRKLVTINELMKEMEKNPSLLASSADDKKKKLRSKRTRKRVDNPQQKYLYASQKAALEKKGGLPTQKKKKKKNSIEEDEEADEREEPTSRQLATDESSPIYQARKMGMNVATQFCDPVIDDVEPTIIGEIRVDDNDDVDDDGGSSGATRTFAYIVEKPAGWSILGGNEGKKKKKEQQDKNELNSLEDASKTRSDFPMKQTAAASSKVQNNKHIKRVKIIDDDDTVDYLEYNELDILAVLTPEERAELEREGGFDALSLTDADFAAARAANQAMKSEEDEDVIERMAELARSEALGDYSHSGAFGTPASFATPARPSVISWLKEWKAAEGTPIRGGKYWKAIAGATDIDDTGLVVLCPKDQIDNIHVEFAKYVAVVGNGKHLAPKGKKVRQTGAKLQYSTASVAMNVLSKLRKGRGDDTVLGVSLMLPDGCSTCADVVQICQNELADGIRGDPNANPLDRRAPRRLIHCSAVSISSLVCDDHVTAELENLPDDIAVLANRRNDHEYKLGSFLGRTSLRENNHTNAYREINSAADGFPGWTVDRYGKWLFVQHDENTNRGPLPSLHDGNTFGVYYLRTNPNRSAMGSREESNKPILLEGKAAPDVITVVENGVTYHARLSDGLSTGIFLDQRPQRAWLAQNCKEQTRVLNCFAHCGAFSVSAAVAGASTVSLDLSKKFLDRIEPQMRANGIENFEERHDCIYGDCFDWLARLSKRGEKFDIVILDPPSTSVGGKKRKRWSLRNDMPELVALAAPLVKRGGLLWTTTNSASIPPEKFASMCRKGLDLAGARMAKLERVAPMPLDFPSIGPQPVKNLVWRIS